MRLRNDPQAMMKLQQTSFLIQEFPLNLTINTTLELGMGKGHMITQLALLHPKEKFIGIEKYATVAYKAAKKGLQMNLKNFKIICDDIKNLANLIEDKVNCIWLTFSDPWPKARHQKRRLTHPNFLKVYAKILKPDGTLKFKTDNDNLFAYSVEMLQNEKWNILTLTHDLHNHIAERNNIMTEYEKKWAALGKNINYLVALPPK